MTDNKQAKPPLGELYLEKRFPQARVLSGRDFVRFCKDRGFRIGLKDLEAFERDGLLSPLFRVRRQEIPLKKVEEGFAPLTEEDDPALAVSKTYGEVSTGIDDLRWHRDRGLITFPGEGPFREWGEYKDRGWDVEIPFYHPLQALAVRPAIRATKVSFTRSILGASPEELAERLETARKGHSFDAKIASGELQHLDELMRLALRVEDALLPNLRLILRGSGGMRGVEEEEPDWWTWRQGLDWDGVLELLGWNAEDIKALYRHWAVNASFDDPLDNWYLLVQNIRYRRRQRLKGAALLAQDRYEVAMMLRAVYREVTGEALPPPDDVHDARGGSWKERWYGTRDVAGNHQARLRLLTDYGLNPTYQVHLLLEGITEEVFALRWAAARHVDMERSGVHVDLLEGTGGLTPSILARTLRHVVEDGGVAYLLVDDDEGVRQNVDDLLKLTDLTGAPLLREEFVRIWKGEFEEENFSIAELVSALNRLAKSLGSKFRTSVGEVDKLRASTGRKITKVLKQLTRDADFDFASRRRKFAELLAEEMVERIQALSETDRYEPVKLIEQELFKVVRLAAQLGMGARLE